MLHTIDQLSWMVTPASPTLRVQLAHPQAGKLSADGDLKLASRGERIEDYGGAGKDHTRSSLRALGMRSRDYAGVQ